MLEVLFIWYLLNLYIREVNFNMSIKMEEKINNIVEDFKQLPYLFIGTGMSMRYSTAPSWNELLKEIWSIVNGDNDREYKDLVKRIEYEIGFNDKKVGDEERKYRINPRLASEIQKQFNKKFFVDLEFKKTIFTEEELDEFYDNNYDPFKFYVAKKTRYLGINKKNGEYAELLALKNNQNKIAGVITTNYDTLLEKVFTDFDILIGQDNLLVSNTNNIFEIYKIHGSATDPTSIVLTEEDYKYFEDKLKYLSAKLLTLFVEHPIIFIGYSVGDLNIRGILGEIAQCLNPNQLEELKRNLIFVNPSSGKEDSISFKEIDFNGRSIAMTEVTLNDYSLLYSSFEKIKSSLSIKIVRKMQDMFCNFIATTEPSKNIVVNVNSTDVDDNELGFYFGNVNVISEMGFDYYGIDDIVEDILFDNKPNLMNEKLLNKTFGRIRSTAGKTYLPVYKYIYGLGLEGYIINEKWHVIRNREDILLNASENKLIKDERRFTSVSEIAREYPSHLPKQFAYILFNIDNIAVDELGEYLREIYNDDNYKTKHLSSIKKLTAVYDFKKYKQN